MKTKKHTIYKIHYAHGLVYIGRTNQSLQQRLRGHFFKKSMHREIDIDAVTLVEYAELPTVADMYLMEIYLINKEKPLLNSDDKARDELTIELPPLEFKPFKGHLHLMDKWKAQIAERDEGDRAARARRLQADLEKALRREKASEMRRKCRDGEITEDEYYDYLEG